MSAGPGAEPGTQVTLAPWRTSLSPHHVSTQTCMSLHLEIQSAKTWAPSTQFLVARLLGPGGTGEAGRSGRGPVLFWSKKLPRGL